MKRTAVFLTLVLALLGTVSANGAERGEYPEDPFPPYTDNRFTVIGPARFFIWDAPLFRSEKHRGAVRWKVYIDGGELGGAELDFYTDPFSLYWDRAFYLKDPDSGTGTRFLAPVGRYRALICATGADGETVARRDVEIVIPPPEKSFYTDYPDVYWPKAGESGAW